MIPLRSGIALETYIDLQNSISDSDMISYNISSSFEFEESNLMLTEEGNAAFKRILCAIENDLKLTYCLVLNNLIKLLLWFLAEHDVFYIVRTLLHQDSYRNSEFRPYFITTKDKVSEMVKSITLSLLQLKGGKQDFIENIVDDMMKKMLIGYISPLYYSFILINFIVEGIEAIVKGIISLFQIINYQHINSIAQFKEQLEIKFNYVQFIHNYSTIEFNLLL